MNIIITGCSGYLGKILIPELLKYNFNILTVGRDVRKLKQIFPKLQCCDYKQLPSKKNKYDYILHLAIENNLKNKNENDYLKTNVIFLKKILEISILLRVKKFIYLRTIHEIDVFNNSKYTVSKRKAHKLLEEEKRIKVQTIMIPFIYSDNLYPNKLEYLNKLPKYISKWILKFLSSLKPTLNVNLLVDQLRTKDESRSICLYQDINKNIFYNLFTAGINFIFSISILIFLFWLLALIFILIIFESGGSSIFKQSRVGRNEKIFTLYKFRTMVKNTINIETHKISQNNITKIGKVLRHYKLDELPQIFNIIKGNINLVGPRPSLTTQKNLIKNRKIHRIMNIKPGITGWAQIRRIDMSNTQKLVKVEKDYMSLRSIFFDLKILFYTFLGYGSGDRIKRK